MKYGLLEPVFKKRPSNEPPSPKNGHDQPRIADNSSTQDVHLVISEPLPENNWGHHSCQTIGAPTMENASSEALAGHLMCLFLLSVCCFLAFLCFKTERTKCTDLDIREASVADREAEQINRDYQQKERQAEQDDRDDQQNDRQAQHDRRKAELNERQAQQANRDDQQNDRQAQQDSYPGEPDEFSGEPDEFPGEPDEFPGEPNVLAGEDADPDEQGMTLLSEKELRKAALKHKESLRKESQRKERWLSKHGNLDGYVPKELTEEGKLRRKCYNYLNKRNRRHYRRM